MEHPVELSSLASRTAGVTPMHGQTGIAERVAKTDWGALRLDASCISDRDCAAKAVAGGAAVVHSFANIYAISFRPDREVMRCVNAAKGRPIDQVASVFPTRRAIEGIDWCGRHEIFDVERLPTGMSADQMISMIRTLYELGPFGFRGPSALKGFSHLTSLSDPQDGDQFPVVQIIAPGYRDDWSADLIDRALEYSSAPVLAITSANRSHHVTGAAEEPAHYRIAGIRDDFADVNYPFVMLAHPNEASASRDYPNHAPMSTSVVGFLPDAAVNPAQPGHRPTVVLERHGSLSAERIQDVLQRLHVKLHIPSGQARRLPTRTYPAAPRAGA